MVLKQLRELKPNLDENDEAIPVDVPLSAAGRKAWIRFFDEHAKREFDACGDLSAALAKLEGYAARFALIFHYVQWAVVPDFNGDEIGPESIEAGAEMARWFCDEAERVYGMFSETDEDRETRELVEYIRARGGSMTVRDLKRGPRQYRSGNAAQEALDELVADGLAAWDHTSTGQPGQPAKRVRLMGGDTGDGDVNRPGGPVNGNTVTVAGVTTLTEHIDEWWTDGQELT